MSDRGMLLLQGGRVVAADGEYDADVLIEGEKIAAVGAVERSRRDASSTSRAAACMPGLIDNHTHLSMPFMGMMSSDDYDTGTRAAAAGGVTCLVDFSIQREPDNLTSALAEWQGRAEGAAHVDYGFHMAITNASEAALDDMEAMTEAGVCSFKLFMAYKGELMVRDDELAAAMERARDLGGLIMVHAENGDVVDLLVKRALARGDTSAINHALTRPGVRRGRGDRPRRPAGRVHRRLAVRRARDLRGRRGRDRGRPAARRARQRARPARSTSSTRSTTCAATGVEGARYICSPPLRDASNHEPLWDYVRRGVLESVSTDHCPFNYEQKSRGLDNFSLVPNGLPVIQHRLAKLWDEGVVAGRITPSQLVDRTSTTIARRFGLEDKGAIAPGKDADIVVFDPSAPRALRRRQLVHERRLRPLRGRDGERQRAPHVLPRRARLRPRRDPHAPGHGRFVAPQRGARGGGRMSLVVDADRVLADLSELHERHGGPDGARRLAWSEDWLAGARVAARGKLDELDGVTVDRDEAGNIWAELPGRRRRAS